MPRTVADRRSFGENRPIKSGRWAAVWRGGLSWLALVPVDRYLMGKTLAPSQTGVRHFAWEFWFFGLKEARACLFAGLFFIAFALMPRDGLAGLSRYDALLIFALLVQAWMLAFGIETFDEFKAVMCFHLIGFALEVFKTSGSIGAWAYPGPGYSKLLGVPLFTGFMYAAVGSYLIQAWRLLDLRVERHPPYWMAALLSLAIYLNFFTHHAVLDVRWYLAAFVLGLYARTVVVFRPLDRERRMPLPLAFLLIGFFLWLAENVGTFFGLWRYPDQWAAWTLVAIGKWSSWALLVIMTFTIVTQLKHIKARIEV